MSFWQICIFFLILTTALPGAAHHSMSAVFDFDQRFTRVGIVTRVDWTNPHIYIHVDAPDEDGSMQSWRFEGPSPVYFRRRAGLGKIDFEAAIGKSVTVDASRARDGSFTGLIRMFLLPDGVSVPLCPDNC